MWWPPGQHAPLVPTHLLRATHSRYWLPLPSYVSSPTRTAPSVVSHDHQGAAPVVAPRSTLFCGEMYYSVTRLVPCLWRLPMMDRSHPAIEQNCPSHQWTSQTPEQGKNINKINKLFQSNLKLALTKMRLCWMLGLVKIQCMKFKLTTGKDNPTAFRYSSSLVQLMACHLIGTKPLPEPMLTYRKISNIRRTKF